MNTDRKQKRLQVENDKWSTEFAIHATAEVDTITTRLLNESVTSHQPKKLPHDRF